jgi:ADP-ribose pyrophosphatase YjhB (NUDIX family)
MNKRVAAVIIKGKKILLMYRIKNGREYFVFPGGGVEENESLETALIREIKEEFNIDVKIEKLLFRIENQGREEFYFLVKEFVGIPEISGEEKERMNENNQYAPAWLNLEEVIKLPNLYPEEAKQKVEELIKKLNGK